MSNPDNSHGLPQDWVAVKRSALRSQKLHAIGLGAELLFYRLLLACDDVGRHPAGPGEMATGPLKRRLLQGDVELDEADRWLEELAHAGLVDLYEVAGERFLQIAGYASRRRRPRPSECPDPTDGARVGHGWATGGPRMGPDRERERERDIPTTSGGPSASTGIALTPHGKPSVRRSGTPQAELVEHWQAEWQRTRGAAWDAARRDFVLAAKVIARAGGNLEEAQHRASRLLAEGEDEWVARNASLGLLLKRWNQLGVEVRRKTKAQARTERTHDMLRRFVDGED